MDWRDARGYGVAFLFGLFVVAIGWLAGKT